MKNYFSHSFHHGFKTISERAFFIFLIAISYSSSFSQSTMTLDQAINTALQNNEGIKSATYEVDYYNEIKKTSSDIGKLNATWMHGQYNSIYQDNNYTITQTFPFPTVLTSQSKLGKEQVSGAQKNVLAAKNELVFEIKVAWFELLYLQALRKVLLSQDSLYSGFARASRSRYQSGESNLLEKTTAETQSLEAKNQILQNESDIRILQIRLQALLKNEFPVATNEILHKLPMAPDTSSFLSNPRLSFLNQQAVIGRQARNVERNKILPEINVGYFNQSLIGVQNINGQDQYFGRSKHFQGFQLGLAIPLWIAPHLARARALTFQEEALRKNAEYFKTTLRSSYEQATQESQKNWASVNYYETSALPNANLILTQAQKAWTGGEIGYVEFLQSVRIAVAIKEKYLHALNQYNQSVIKIEYLIGNI